MWCEMQGPDGGWITLFERRNATFDFFRNWISYENGFGKPGFDFWIGNSHMHIITLNGRHIVRFEILDYFDESNQPFFAEYDDFKVLSPSTKYILQVGKFRGNLADILSGANNSAFSTWDRDNDKTDKACAIIRKGAWWYGDSCVTHDPNSMRVFFSLTMKVREILGGKVFLLKKQIDIYSRPSSIFSNILELQMKRKNLAKNPRILKKDLKVEKKVLQ